MIYLMLYHTSKCCNYFIFVQEQKLQLHLLTKEDHQKNVNEFEKCHATITCQFRILKSSHERLEENGKLSKRCSALSRFDAQVLENTAKPMGIWSILRLRQILRLDISSCTEHHAVVSLHSGITPR